MGGAAIDATMMAFPLTTQMIFRRGERLFPDHRITHFDGTALRHATFADAADRARRLAGALRGLGLAMGERVGTLCWNDPPHLDAYLAVPAMGAVLHTINVRLFPDQLRYIIDHAGDAVLLADTGLVPLIAPILPALPTVRHLIVHGGPIAPIAGFAGAVHDYDTLIAAAAPIADWPVIDEWSAAVMCYTSGTTGNPKGVVYSHRSIFLHSLASLGVDTFAISEHDRILMVPSMFHANAWGMPFSAWFAGSDMILPGPHLQPARIAELIAATRPTLMAAVPTILNDLLQAHGRAPMDLSCFRAIIAGGSAVSPVLIERVKAAWSVDIVQGWGMTETSPICVLSHPPRGATAADAVGWRARSGRPVPGMEVRIVDDADRPLPDDGTTIGNLQLRGPWVTAGYAGQAAADAPLSPDGWLRTGDAGTIDPRGYVQITDRTKDLIKSGGEWISSVELENAISRLDGVAEVAVIAVPDPRWEERPLALVVMAAGDPPDFGTMRAALAKEIAKFMIPEYWASVSALPKTGVGKIDKKQLRGEIAQGILRYDRITGVAAPKE